MVCLSFALLLIVLSWIAIVHMLNSSSKAGQLARLFALGLIEKTVGRREKPSSVGEDGEEKTSE